MNFSRPRLPRTVLTLAALTLSAIFASAQLQIGSPNTAAADPSVPRPKTTPCVVQLFTNVKFADFNPKSFQYTPPAACPGPWAKVVLTANFSVQAGRQFDRTANIWIGGTNVYFGTTAEPSHDVRRHWHIERDLTDYSALFTAPQGGEVDLGNLVNTTFTSSLFGSAQLSFYPLAQGQMPPVTADQVIPFAAGPTGETVALFNTTSLLEQTLTLPKNIQAAYFDVFSQSQSGDEFWYSCVPNDVSGELQSCPGTAFRESEVTIDGVPAGVAPVYPWIYTGGIDPFLWRPIPGVQALNFVPYRVNLTPFVAMLDDGNPHTVALSVFNADSYFSATASLLLYLDHGSTQVTGSVMQNTLTVPSPAITENLKTSTNGTITGSVKTLAAHKFVIAGVANTSSGPVTTTLSQNLNFSNIQVFKINSIFYQQDISQKTTIHSTAATRDTTGSTVRTENDTWPLQADIVLNFNPDGSGTQATTIQQAYQQDVNWRHNGQVTAFSVVRDAVQPTDTLDFAAGFVITGNSNQSNAQQYFASDSTGYCYSRSITAAGGVLTGVVNGQGCSK